MEKWDLYDENRIPLNKTHFRKDKIPFGQYHIVVGIWTVNDNNEILLTLRDPNKDAYPNMWENTGGSVLAGESSIKGATRELYEETGISINENELFLLGTERTENSFTDTYIVRKNMKISDLKMQPGETVDAQWVSLQKLDKMINENKLPDPVVTRLNKLRSEFESFLFSKQIQNKN